MAKPRGRAVNRSSVNDAIQLTLEQLLDQQLNQPVEWEFEEEDIGGDLIGILSKGLYSDPLDCIREYVQNSVDAKAKLVTIKITGNSVIVSDDGIGMTVESLRQSRRLGVSNKSQAENVGFRGIGIYSSFDICNRLLVTTKRVGETKARILEFQFGDMKAQLREERDTNSVRSPLTKLITKFTHFRQEEDTLERHYTIVQMEELSRDHIKQLANHEQLRNYMLRNLPIDFASNFPYKDLINNQLESSVPGYNAIQVKLITDFFPPEIIVRPNIPNLSEPIMAPIVNADGKKIAYYWACYHAKGGEIPDEYKEYRGIVYKVKGFTVGNRDRLREYFSTARGTLYFWCTGEIYVIDENVVPNSARNDFEASPEKLQLETAVGDTFRELNSTIARFQEKNNADKEFNKVDDYLNSVEKKFGTFSPSDCKTANDFLEKYLPSLKKKQKKTSLPHDEALNIILRAESLKNNVRQMIDHPLKSVGNPIVDQVPPSEISPVHSQGSLRPIPQTKTVLTSSSSFPKDKNIVFASPQQQSISNNILPSSIQEREVVQNVVSHDAPPQVAKAMDSPERLKSRKTLLQVCLQTGLALDASYNHLLQVIDKSLSLILSQEIYERVIDDIDAQLEEEVAEEVDSGEE